MVDGTMTRLLWLKRKQNAHRKSVLCEKLEVKMSRPRVKIISNESGDWEIIQCDEFEASGHR